jgi:hypothetical protein
MFDKIGRLAEAAATNVSVSRRGFFGQLGRGALVVAGALGGLLGAAGPARAGGSVPCCGFGKCGSPGPGCVLVGESCESLYGRHRQACYWRCDGGATSKTSKCS